MSKKTPANNVIPFSKVRKINDSAAKEAEEVDQVEETEVVVLNTRAQASNKLSKTQKDQRDSFQLATEIYNMNKEEVNKALVEMGGDPRGVEMERLAFFRSLGVNLEDNKEDRDFFQLAVKILNMTEEELDKELRTIGEDPDKVGEEDLRFFKSTGFNVKDDE